MALAHPLRTRILGRLDECKRASASELARDLGERRGTVKYHLGRLTVMGFVEIVGRVSTGGATAACFAIASRDGPREMLWDVPQRTTIVEAELVTLWRDVEAAIRDGRLDGSDARLVRRAAHLDETGKADLSIGLRNLWARLREIERRSSGRVDADPTCETRAVQVVTIAFEPADA